MCTLEPQGNGPLYSNKVIGTLAVNGWATGLLQVVDDSNVTFELQLTATDHGDTPRSTATPLTVTFIVSRLISPASRGTAAGRRRAGAPLLDGWVPVAVAAACALGLVLVCTVFAVLACVVHRRRRDCTKRHQNAEAALPLTGKYNCRVESLKLASICDSTKG